jgi:pimeloyl-ACP methyl ester carboxylesterase
LQSNRDARIAAILTLFVAPVLPAARVAVPAVEVKPHPCRFAGVRDDARCATYPVWEDREKKAGRKIGLNIVILPALEREPAPDPIFFLHGGPGAAATDAAPGLSQSRWRAKRDIVLIDQRGTGGSNPLDCDFYGDPPDLQRVVSEMFPLDSVRACRERLSKIADLRLYTTALGMDDVDEVRQWLGYRKINIYSGSYGTVSAQVYLQRHEASVRTVVLASVAPVDELIPLHHAWAGQRAVDIIFDKCRADAACNGAYPNLRGEFAGLLARVRKGVEVDVRIEGRSARVKPSLLGFTESLRHYLYYDDGRSLPKMIHESAQGDLAPLIERGITAQLGLDKILAMGMNLSVTCSEDIPFIDDATLAHETAGTFIGDLRVQAQRRACQEWVRGEIPKELHRMVHSPVPVLLISGARDSVTPPDFAARVAKELPNSLHVVFPESSHGNWGPCGPRIMGAFFESGTVAGLDVSCVSQQKATAFVIGGGG